MGSERDGVIRCTGKITTFRRVWKGAPSDPFDPSSESEDSETLGTDWAAEGVFAELLYSTYSEKYFEDWSAAYDPMGRDAFKGWVLYDFGKPGSGSQDRQAFPKLVDAWTYDSKYDGNTVCRCFLYSEVGPTLCRCMQSIDVPIEFLM